MEFLKDLFFLLGRICISLPFLWGAYERIKHWHEAANRLKAKNVPHVSIVLPTSVGLKIIGALMIFFGWHAHIGAFLLLVSMFMLNSYELFHWLRDPKDKVNPDRPNK